MFRITVQSEGSEGNPHYWLMKMENLLFRSRPSAVRLYSVEKINMSRVIKSGVMVNAISRSCTSMVSLSRLSDSNVILDQGETLGLFKIRGNGRNACFYEVNGRLLFPTKSHHLLVGSERWNQILQAHDNLIWYQKWKIGSFYLHCWIWATYGQKK